MDGEHKQDTWPHKQRSRASRKMFWWLKAVTCALMREIMRLWEIWCLLGPLLASVVISLALWGYWEIKSCQFVIKYFEQWTKMLVMICLCSNRKSLNLVIKFNYLWNLGTILLTGNYRNVNVLPLTICVNFSWAAHWKKFCLTFQKFKKMPTLCTWLHQVIAITIVQ